MTHNNNDSRIPPVPPLPSQGQVVPETSAGASTPGSEWHWLDPLFPEEMEAEPAEPPVEDEDVHAVDEAVVDVVAEAPPAAAALTADFALADLGEAAASTRDLPMMRQPEGRSRWALAAVAGCVVVVAGAVCWLAVELVGGGGSPSPTTVAAESVSASAAAAVDASAPCAASAEGGVVRGAGPGDQRTGPGVIERFNYGYYVTRSAAAARAVTAKDAVGDEAEMQKFIDAVPADAAHCLLISERGPDLWAVQLTVTAPGQAPDVVHQLITTTTGTDGRVWITSIKKDPQG